MRDAYAGARPPAGHPAGDPRGRVQGLRRARAVRPPGRRLAPVRLELPPNPLRPGDPGELPTFWEIAATRQPLGAGRLARPARATPPTWRPRSPHHELLPDWFEDLAGRVAGDLLELPARRGGAPARRSRSASPASAPATPTTPSPRRPPSRCCWCACSRPSATGSGPPSWRRRYQEDPELRLFFTVVDAGVSTVAGIVKDGVLEHGFDAINDEDWAAWLRRHGAREVTIGRTPAERSPLLRAVYDVAFAYPGRRHRRTPTGRRHRHQRPAAARLHLPRLGHVQDAGGHGRRRVRARSTRCSSAAASSFEFFHAVTALQPGAATAVDSIEVVPQVDLAPHVDEYDPLRSTSTACPAGRASRAGSSSRRRPQAEWTSRPSSTRSSRPARRRSSAARTSTRSCSASRSARCPTSAAS